MERAFWKGQKERYEKRLGSSVRTGFDFDWIIFHFLLFFLGGVSYFLSVRDVMMLNLRDRQNAPFGCSDLYIVVVLTAKSTVFVFFLFCYYLQLLFLFLPLHHFSTSSSSPPPLLHL